MTSGRKLTEQQRMHILRHHAEGMRWGAIAQDVGVDYRTVRAVVCEAARRFYELVRPNRLDELSDPH